MCGGGEMGSNRIGKVEYPADDAFDLLRRTIGSRRCASVSPPYRFTCGGDHQPCLQSKILCLSVGERFLPQTEVNVGLEE